MLRLEELRQKVYRTIRYCRGDARASRVTCVWPTQGDHKPGVGASCSWNQNLVLASNRLLSK